MSWFLLIIAGVLETVWAVGMGYTHGFTRLWPSIGVGIAMVASFVLLAQVTKVIPAGTAYAVWVGIGVLGAFFVDSFLQGQTPSLLRVGLVVMLVGSVIGLSLTGRPH